MNSKIFETGALEENITKNKKSPHTCSICSVGVCVCARSHSKTTSHGSDRKVKEAERRRRRRREVNAAYRFLFCHFFSAAPPACTHATTQTHRHTLTSGHYVTHRTSCIGVRHLSPDSLSMNDQSRCRCGHIVCALFSCNLQSRAPAC